MVNDRKIKYGLIKNESGLKSKIGKGGIALFINITKGRDANQGSQDSQFN